MERHACDNPASKANVEVASTAKLSGSSRPKSSEYPGRAKMAGKIVLPDFKKRDREFNSFRTRIREGMKNWPNFAGH